MKIPFQFRPQLFNTCFVTAEAELGSDVSTESPGAASIEATTDSSTAEVETSGESQGGVNATEEAQTTQQTAEVDPLEGVPTAEELQQLVEQKTPYSEALARLRPAYETAKAKLTEYQGLDPWKPLVETIGDPALAQSSYELVSAIHTPLPENPSGFTSRPFLERLEQESPGTVDQVFADICSFTITGENGQPTTVVRELYKSHGLDPDRIEDYRNIDSLRVSGIVSADDLGKIPEKYHDAFKTLSSVAREDVLSLAETNPATMEEYLRNAQDALEARTWRQKDEQAKQQAVQAEQRQFEQQVEQAVEQDILAEVKSISGLIHQNLSSQFKPSSDETTNNLEYAKVMSVLATLQNPAYRFVAENALKAVGVSLDGFDDLTNQWQAKRSAFITYQAMGQQESFPAKRALAGATQAKQRMLIKLNDYALKLAQVSGNRLAAQSEQTATQLAAASGRFVPSGNGLQQEGAINPFDNPYPLGSPEYKAHIARVSRELGATGASVFGGN